MPRGMFRVESGNEEERITRKYLKARKAFAGKVMIASLLTVNHVGRDVHILKHNWEKKPLGNHKLEKQIASKCHEDLVRSTFQGRSHAQE